MSNRAPGRYNLHRLGWAAFEDLCMQVMRVVLGETCTRFTAGRDGGRDGWFEGQAIGELKDQNGLNGRFVVQCKHTSSADDLLDISHVKSELQKLARLAKEAAVHYVLMTNRRVTAQTESLIRTEVEQYCNGGKCIVLGETWIEDTVDAHPRLLRLVPRLYGIGDLSQILSFTLQQQTAAVLEDLTPSLRTFVPTEPYRNAERVLREHGFLVLVGPPASGKSAIAANLCMVTMAQEPETRVLRIEQAEQFKSTWSPTDQHTLYWVDDVFGETTLDDERLRDWAAAIEKVEAARKRGSRIIFCTRDYILAAASQKIRQSKVEIINDARVRVEVTKLTGDEKEAILYNHIKHGNLERIQKQLLKKHLATLAKLEAFTPELARRLGNKRFNVGLTYELGPLKAFFESPVSHFREVIHGLSNAETAVLSICLMGNNSVPDPIPTDSIPKKVLETFDVTVSEIRESFESLDGSLVKRVRKDCSQFWQVHHPSMIDALQKELSGRSSRLILYLQVAQLKSIFRDTTMIQVEGDTRHVFIPDSVYPDFVQRLTDISDSEIAVVGHYLSNRASDSFLLYLDQTAPTLIDRLLGLEPEPEGWDTATDLAVRLSSVKPSSLLTAVRQTLLLSAIGAGIDNSGHAGFLEVDALMSFVAPFAHKFLEAEICNDFESLMRLANWYEQDLSSEELIDSAIDGIQTASSRLMQALGNFHLLSDDVQACLMRSSDYILDDLNQKKADWLEAEDRRADMGYDDWNDRWEGSSYVELGRFSDVDE